MQVLRVYNESVEYEDHPLPGHVTSHRSDLVRSDRSLSSVSLHHLVRVGDSEAAQTIRSIDQRVSRHDDVTSHDVELYRAAVKEREQELLTTADVILCTCVTSAAARIASTTNIMQVLLSVCLFF